MDSVLFWETLRVIHNVLSSDLQEPAVRTLSDWLSMEDPRRPLDFSRSTSSKLPEMTTMAIALGASDVIINNINIVCIDITTIIDAPHDTKINITQKRLEATPPGSYKLALEKISEALVMKLNKVDFSDIQYLSRMPCEVQFLPQGTQFELWKVLKSFPRETLRLYPT